MGHELLYCGKCNNRLTAEDLKHGGGRVGESVFCSLCAPTPKPGTLKAPPATTRIARPKAEAADKNPAPAKSGNMGLVIGIVVGAVVLAGVIIVALQKGPDKPAAPKVASAPPPAAEAVKPPPPVSAERFTDELAALDEEIRTPLARGNFRLVEQQLEKAHKRRADPEWQAQVARRMREAQEKEKAAMARGPVEDRREAPAPVAAKAPPPADKEAPRSPEAQEYLSKWRECALRAGARDFDLAATRLEALRNTLSEKPVLAEHASDLADLRLAAGAYKGSRTALAALEPGSALSVDRIDPASGARRTVKGSVLQAGGDYVVLKVDKQEAPSIVGVEEMTAAALAKLQRGDARPLALFCLFEGDAAAAKALLGGGRIHEKYWEYAKDAASSLPKPDASAAIAEREARMLFHLAGKEYDAMATLGEAVGKYKALLKDFMGTSVVLKNIDLVTKRGREGVDYPFVTADLVGAGTFKKSKHDVVGPCLVSSKDSEPIQAKANFVEFGFYLLPGTDYKCWVLMGGCCAEVFGCLWQATELKTENPKKRSETVPVEPDGNMALPLKLSLSGLKKDHASHGGEKEPARWEWVAVALPKYSGPGLKKVRLLTDQKGFSVAQAIVSATRKSPPELAKVKEEKPAADRPGVAKAPKIDPALVGWWTFEGVAGDSAPDSSGKGTAAKLQGGAAAAAEGSPAGGNSLKLDGKDDHATVADGASYDAGTGSFTVALWLLLRNGEGCRLINKFKDGEAKWLIDANSAGGGKKASGKLRFHLTDKKDSIDETLDTALPTDGKTWAHLVVVVDRAAKEARAYVNGAPAGAPLSIAKVQGALSNSQAIGIGNIPGKNGKHLNGSVDDVRYFARALAPAEIAALARAR